MIGSIVVQRLLNPCIKKKSSIKETVTHEIPICQYTQSHKKHVNMHNTHIDSHSCTPSHHTHTYTHIYVYIHITGTYCTRVLQETRVDESVSRELQLMQSSQVFFFLYFLQHRNSYHYDIIGIVVRSCCILNTFSVTTILF